MLLPSELVDPGVGQPGTPALPVPFPRTGQGGEPHLTLPDAITGNPGDPRYPYREPLPAPPPGGPPPGPPALGPAPGELPPPTIGPPVPEPAGRGTVTMSSYCAQCGSQPRQASSSSLPWRSRWWPRHGGTASARNTFAAYFANANGLYTGDEVRILGVEVGTVEAIDPQPGRTKVTFSVDKQYPVPADVQAAILSPSLVTARAIQLVPAYSGGPKLAAGATIPQNRTAVPVEWDDFRQQLEKLTDSLQPTTPGGPERGRRIHQHAPRTTCAARVTPRATR